MTENNHLQFQNDKTADVFLYIYNAGRRLIAQTTESLTVGQDI